MDEWNRLAQSGSFKTAMANKDSDISKILKVNSLGKYNILDAPGCQRVYPGLPPETGRGAARDEAVPHQRSGGHAGILVVVLFRRQFPETVQRLAFRICQEPELMENSLYLSSINQDKTAVLCCRVVVAMHEGM